MLQPARNPTIKINLKGKTEFPTTLIRAGDATIVHLFRRSKEQTRSLDEWVPWFLLRWPDWDFGARTRLLNKPLVLVHRQVCFMALGSMSQFGLRGFSVGRLFVAAMPVCFTDTE